MATNDIPETITDPEVFLAEIEKDIPDTTIIGSTDDPVEIPPIAMVPVTVWGTQTEAQITYNQEASTSLKESASSRTLNRTVQTTIEQEAINTQLEEGGDTIQTVKVRPSLSTSISIPISLQV